MLAAPAAGASDGALQRGGGAFSGGRNYITAAIWVGSWRLYWRLCGFGLA